MSWSQLEQIIKLNEKEDEKESMACPICGNTLVKTKRGRHCDFCGYLED